MVPDRNLAQYTSKHASKKIHSWNGYCPIHDNLTASDVKKVKNKYPDAVFVAHPECRPEVLELADNVLSTSGMLRYAGEVKNRDFIVGTEVGLLYPLKKANPDKNFYPASEQMLCPDMKKTTLEDIARSLEFMEGEVKVPENIRQSAFKAVQRMVDLSLLQR
jgi:quinolinate synthase